MSTQEQREIRRQARKTMLAIEQQDKLLEELQTKKKTSNSIYKYILKSEFITKTYYNTIDLETDLMVSSFTIMNYFKYPNKREKNLITQLGFTLERVLINKLQKNNEKCLTNTLVL